MTLVPPSHFPSRFQSTGSPVNQREPSACHVAPWNLLAFLLCLPTANALIISPSMLIMHNMHNMHDLRAGRTLVSALPRNRPCTALAMSPPIWHLGNSHAHHQHDHMHQRQLHPVDGPATVSTLSKVSSQQKVQQDARQWRRRFALGLFCALATVSSKLIQRRPFQRTDWIIMTLSIVALSSADKIKRNLVEYLQKIRGLGDAIAKHSGRNQGQSTTANTISYLASSASRSQLDTTEADRVTWIGVVVNVVLSVGKLAVGIMQHSSVLIADAGHSFSDLISDFITLWSVQVARLPPDEDHPYGHTKFEAIGSLFLSLTLLATGLSVGIMAHKQLVPFLSGTALAASVAPVTVPGPLALFMAGLSIASKEWLFRITKVVGEKLNSPVVVANAWHHRSDAYSSVLALLSIAWAMSGFPAADAAAGLLVAGMIGMTGCDIMVESIQQLSDSAHLGLQEELQILTEAWIQTDPDVLKISSLRARQVGSSAFCDVTVEISPNLSTTATRALEERLKKYLVAAISERTGRVVTLTVHAKAPLLVCPLLEAADNSALTAKSIKEQTSNASSQSGQEEGFDRSRTFTGLSAGQVEMQVRQRALLVEPHQEVQTVTVHYQSPQSVSVDVTVRSTIASDLPQLRLQAKRLQAVLEEQITEIHSARIYLDLLSDPSSSSSDNLRFLQSLPIPSSEAVALSNLWNGPVASQNATSVEGIP